MSNFVFTCPHCANQFYAQEDWIGASVDCPNCGNEILIEKTVFPVHNSFIPAQENNASPVLIWGALSGLSSFLFLHSLLPQLTFLLKFFLPPYVYRMIEPFWAISLAAVGAVIIGYCACRMKTRVIMTLSISASVLSYDFLSVLVSHPLFLEFAGLRLTDNIAKLYWILGFSILFISAVIGILLYCFLSKNSSQTTCNKGNEMTKTVVIVIACIVGLLLVIGIIGGLRGCSDRAAARDIQRSMGL